MKISEYRRSTRETLGRLFGDEAGPLCDVLLCAFLDVDHSKLLLMADDEIPEEITYKMSDAIDRLGMGVPVQYIIGNCWFYGLKIQVGQGCFIPRSDTENLVKAAIGIIPQGGSFVDICSGSGCISAAVSATRPDVKGCALEYSYKALPYTEKNLEAYPNVSVRRCDALDESDYDALAEQFGHRFDAILCNPPYIKREDMDTLQQQVLYEPHTALDGGEDGLDYYRTIIPLAPIILKDSGAIIFEVGAGEAEDVGNMLREAGYKVAFIRDVQGIERVVLGKKY